MSIGFVLKRERIKKNLKLLNVAQGICSVSHLSKIENNTTEASEEVINLLIDRLNIKVSEISSEEEEHIINQLYSEYLNVLKRTDHERLVRYIDEISTKHFKFTNDENNRLYILYLFRLLKNYHDDDVNILDDLYSVIKPLTNSNNKKERFLSNFNLGLYYHEKKNRSIALQYMESALELAGQVVLDNVEKGDFYNALSLTYALNDDTQRAFRYATVALKIFNEQLLLTRAIDCYFVIARYYKNTLDFENAEKNYRFAQQLSSNLGLNEYTELVYQNLGSLYSAMGESAKAIDYYSFSLEKRKKGSEKYFLTVWSLVKEFSKEKDHSQVTFWCNHAFELAKEMANNQLEPYIVHLKVYFSIHNKVDSLETDLKKAIRFFEKHNDLRHVQKYSYILAEHYSEKNKYKAASAYYKKCMTVEFIKKSVAKWQDL